MEAAVASLEGREESNQKRYTKLVTDLLTLLKSSRPPSLADWKTKARKLDEEVITAIAVDVIKGERFFRELSNWSQFAIALTALDALVDNCGYHQALASTLAEKATTANDELQKRMWDREKQSCAVRGEVEPALESIERKDVHAESKYQGIEAFFEENNLTAMVKTILRKLKSCINNEEKPTEVVYLIRQLPLPPGVKDGTERRREASMLAAKEAAEQDSDDEFMRGGCK